MAARKDAELVPLRVGKYDPALFALGNVDLDVHPRVTMEVLGHTDFDLTMEIYAQVSSQATRDALKRMGESLDG